MRYCFQLLVMTIFTLCGTWVQGTEFGYSGDIGPGYWGELDPSWIACSTDLRQTPIDISRATLDNALKSLDLELRDTEIELINNGHTIEQEYEPGSTLSLNGVIYDLLQFHFHTFSEHTVRGVRYPMEMHAVFRNPETGNLAVLGTFFRIGGENKFLSEFDDHLPQKDGDHFTSEHHINIADALTETSSYYTYDGSLTTPPCSPIVTWFVLKEAATISEEQFHSFQNIMGNNFRPLQPRNDRVIRTTAKGGVHKGQ
ncbi:carbonic anhydrase family protein [bacterium]|nr:carbonic anhydrase family protein [bacterium]MCI0603372.1 carbonic anhydrase family protein [bacterium]